MTARARTTKSFEELYDEIVRLPDGLTGEILEPGVIRTMSRPGKAHRRAAKWCARSLERFDANLGGTGWWIEIEAEIRFPVDRLAVSDLTGWRVERVPELPDENPLTVLPDWCCEILSPRTARQDRSLKLPLYAGHVPWTWLVDPELRIVEVFESVAGRATLAVSAKETEVAVLPPFEHEIDLAPWWLT